MSSETQMREELKRAGIRQIDERVRMGRSVDRRDMTVVASTSYGDHAGLRKGQIYVRAIADPDTGEDIYEVQSWDGQQPHLIGEAPEHQYSTLDEAAEAWLEAVQA